MPETEYFLWLTIPHPFEEICFYSTKDSHDAQLVSRLCRLFTLKYSDASDLPTHQKPEFDYRAAADLDPDVIFLIREEIQVFGERDSWEPKHAENHFHNLMRLGHDRQAIGSFCLRQAAVWENALRAEMEGLRREESPEEETPGAREAGSYYLRLCIHKEDREGKTLDIQSFDGVEEEVTYFYHLQNKQLAERLARLFNRRFEDRNEGVRDAYCILHTFDCVASSELDEDERFFIDEEINEIAAEVSGYEAQWQVDCFELGEPPWVYDPYDPPLYDQDNPLSAGALHHQASKWEQSLTPNEEPTNEEMLATVFPEAQVAGQGVSPKSQGKGTEQAAEGRAGAETSTKRSFDARGLVGDERQQVYGDVLALGLSEVTAVLIWWDKEVSNLARGGPLVFDAEDTRFLEWVHKGRPDEGPQPASIAEKLMQQTFLIATALEIDPTEMWEYTTVVVDSPDQDGIDSLRDAAMRTLDRLGAEVELAQQKAKLGGMDAAHCTLAEAAGFAPPAEARSEDAPTEVAVAGSRGRLPSASKKQKEDVAEEPDGVYPHHVRIRGIQCELTKSQRQIVEHMWDKATSPKSAVCRAVDAWQYRPKNQAIHSMLDKLNTNLRKAGIRLQFHFRDGHVVKK